VGSPLASSSTADLLVPPVRSHDGAVEAIAQTVLVNDAMGEMAATTKTSLKEI
jgi:hypothetical protein